MFVANVTVATALLGRLSSASVAVQSAEEHPSLQVLSPVRMPITVTSCTGECGGSVTVYCTTRNATAATRPIVVDAPEFDMTYHELDCEPDAS